MRGLALAAALLVVLPATATAAGRVNVELKLASATPVAGKPWRWTVTVRSEEGKPLTGRLRLQVLLGKTVVDCWKRGKLVPCTGGDADWTAVRGKRTGVVRWPREAVGVKWVFLAVVKVGRVTLKLRSPIRVKSARANRASA